MSTTPARATRSSDRGIYPPAAIAVCALVVAGFWRSYFSKLFAAPSEPLTVLVHLHGALMTTWVGLFVAQVALVAFGRTDLHRRLGTFGFPLLALIVVVAIPMIITAARLGGNHMPGPALPSLALVLGLLLEFVTLASLALAYRRRPDVHKRLMTLAACAAMEAGVARLPLDLLDSVTKTHIANDLVPLLIVVVDTVRHRRLHPAFLWGGLLLVSIQALSTWASGTDTWLRIAEGLMSHLP